MDSESEISDDHPKTDQTELDDDYSENNDPCPTPFDYEDYCDNYSTERIKKIMNERSFCIYKDGNFFSDKKVLENLITLLENMDKFNVSSIFYGNEEFFEYIFEMNSKNSNFNLLVNNKLCFLIDNCHLKILLHFAFYPNPYKLYLCDQDDCNDFFNRIIFFKKYAWKNKVYTKRPESLFFKRCIISEFLENREIVFIDFKKRRKVEKRFLDYHDSPEKKSKEEYV